MTHIVQKGETLIQIAKKYNTSLATLIDENNIKNPNLISVGSTLIISEPNQKIISHPELTPDNIDAKIEDFLNFIEGKKLESRISLRRSSYVCSTLYRFTYCNL